MPWATPFDKFSNAFDLICDNYSRAKSEVDMDLCEIISLAQEGEIVSGRRDLFEAYIDPDGYHDERKRSKAEKEKTEKAKRENTKLINSMEKRIHFLKHLVKVHERELQDWKEIRRWYTHDRATTLAKRAKDSYVLASLDSTIGAKIKIIANYNWKMRKVREDDLK